MSVPFIDLSKQHQRLLPELRRAFEQVIESGRLVLGPYVEQFEQNLAQYCGADYAVGVSSGADALLVILMAMNVGPGDEVILPAFSYIHTAEAVVRLGAKPVFVDINPRTYNLSADAIEGALTDATRAIIAVHSFGLPTDMDQMMEIAEQHHIKVIEDGDQALGARYDDRPVGSLGHAAAFSFYTSKNLPALGDAGACVTDDGDLADRIRRLRIHGLEGEYTFRTLGGNFRLDALQAAILNIKLPHLEAWNDRRRALADRYGRALEELPVATPFEAERRHHVFDQYTIRIRGHGRDGLLAHLDACDIGNRVYYPTPLHLQPCFTSLGYKPGNLPETEAAAQQVLSLPIFPEMTDAQQDNVIDVVRDYFSAE